MNFYEFEKISDFRIRKEKNFHKREKTVENTCTVQDFQIFLSIFHLLILLNIFKNLKINLKNLKNVINLANWSYD